MLPPFIIEQIRKREDEERRIEKSPFLELPLPMPSRAPEHTRREDSDADRGVVIIDLLG